MKEELLDYLACPDCGNELDLEIFCKEEAEIKDGVFVCKNCHNNYFLIGYIPRFLPVDVIAKSDLLAGFVSKYGERLGHMDVLLSKSKTDFIDDDYRIRLKTIEYFGYEWKKFTNWGWLEEDNIPKEECIKYDGGFVSNTISAFKIKSLMTGEDLSSGKLVLDAGCGNGRFSNQAAKYGAEVIGVDIGTGTVEAAYENTKEMDNIHIIQGDLFKLPFKKNIMHTGDAYRAFKSIASHVKTGGGFTAHVYHKLNPVWEINDFLLRKITTNMSVENNVKFANFMSKLGRSLLKMGLFNVANLFVRVQPTLIHMYDWYSAPIATHPTYGEVRRWYIENNFEILMTNKSKSQLLLIKPWGLTVKGAKRK